MGIGRSNWMMRAHYCVPSIPRLGGTGSPECPLASNPPVRYSKSKMKQPLQAFQVYIYVVADDLIIAAEDVDEHEKILHQVLQRAKDWNIKLNFANYSCT